MIGKDLDKAIAYLEKGLLVGMPTETVYGLAGNALNEQAILRIFKAKNRPYFDPLIVHIGHLEKINQYAQNIPEQALLLAQHFMPGPLTLLLEKKEIIPDLVTAGSQLVAIRIPSHPLSLSLLSRLNFPLAAPSANPFGYISPTTAQHVSRQLADQVSYILDGGPSQIGLESTIVGFENNEAVIYRKGGLAIEAIASIIGKVQVKAHSTSNPKSPGQLKSHYAPSTPFQISQDIPSLLDQYHHKKVGVLSFQQAHTASNIYLNLVLSSKGMLEEAAQNLFAMMRKLDEAQLDIILAELVPDKQLGRAINDRLKRASVQEKTN